MLTASSMLPVNALSKTCYKKVMTTKSIYIYVNGVKYKLPLTQVVQMYLQNLRVLLVLLHSKSLKVLLVLQVLILSKNLRVLLSKSLVQTFLLINNKCLI